MITSQPRSRIWKLVKWVIFAVIIVALGAATAGAGYQAMGTWSDSRRFPQRGESVQAGPVKLNLNCTGQGEPAVILDSGSGVPAVGWIKVQPEVAKFARVCSYDRAGYGWSEPGPEPRTSLQIAKELKMLLDAANEKGPYLLVGHSFGGFNMRVFAGQYPSNVAGMGLVDASHEDEETRQEGTRSAAEKEQMKRDEERAERLDRFLTPFQVYLGIQRLALAVSWDTPNYLSKNLQQELLYLSQQRKTRNALVSERDAFSQSVAQVRAAGNLDDRPLIVLTAAYNNDPSLTEEERNLWINVLQVDEAHLSARGRQIVVQDTGHMIPFEQPRAVIDAIRQVYDTVRSK